MQSLLWLSTGLSGRAVKEQLRRRVSRYHRADLRRLSPLLLLLNRQNVGTPKQLEVRLSKEWADPVLDSRSTLLSDAGPSLEPVRREKAEECFGWQQSKGKKASLRVAVSVRHCLHARHSGSRGERTKAGKACASGLCCAGEDSCVLEHVRLTEIIVHWPCPSIGEAVVFTVYV